MLDMAAINLVSHLLMMFVGGGEKYGCLNIKPLCS